MLAPAAGKGVQGIRGDQDVTCRRRVAPRQPFGAGSLAATVDQQFHCCRIIRRDRPMVLAPRAGGL
jgi:hypothetical protein